MKLDRTIHNAYNFKEQLPESEKYKGISFEERILAFNYLQSVAYNFELNKYPQMDKSIHSCRNLKDDFNKDIQNAL